ncbi:peptidase S1 and S6 chymotrypsin/Hap [Natrialba hulunbeirensis JCM 10989]|uniref:Peptidase S1 and S6 chymotrypsin/Hap n=1 Tax=Natrialba hulunbeirensis JCM 10989 TaxID=1227493 RepID=M0A5H9_9EURY|nr:trypsin-like peptidase domain-containing protein [Natrialba hulunbeirensis]ELY93829.1 peptidase S1 and S6 chymotrypsin/Hap [Natrialba hulunbeirensis JCM 10989]
MGRQRQHELSRRRLLRAGSSAAVVGISAGAGVGTGGADRVATRRLQDDTADDENGEDSDDPFDAGGPYADVYDDIIDDVVLVTVVGSDDPFDDDPGGIGSGFVVGDHVVTNAHVVGEASTVELQFRDEQWREGEVVGTDSHSDLAAIAVDDLPDITDGLSFTADDPVIGQEALVLGNPLGLDASLSQGIVSGLDRQLPSPTGFAIPAAIQTDAPVNPGNSGGPLVSLDGEVLGVVFAGAGQTIGFAIAAQLADRVIPALVEDGEYEHPYMGIGVSAVGPQVAEANDLEEARGVLVSEVVPDSPADGVLEPIDGETMIDGDPVPIGGDVIVSIGDEDIPNEARLTSVLALETTPGETVELEVIREGESQQVEVTLEERPDVDLP